jgi:hypothetical protein
MHSIANQTNCYKVDLAPDDLKTKQSGFNIIELVIVITAVLFLVFVGSILVNGGSNVQERIAIKCHARGIWSAVVSANADADIAGTNTVWPYDLGFDSKRTSTEYFHQLAMIENGHATNSSQGQSVLTPMMLSGMGVPASSSIEKATSRNNLWQVVCVGKNTVRDSAFLITRNANVGNKANAKSCVIRNHDCPCSLPEWVFWINAGGATYAFHSKHRAIFHRWEDSFESDPPHSYILTGEYFFPNTNETYDVMQP